MSPTSRPLGVAGLLLATSAWGSLFLVGKPALQHVDPLWFTLSRYTIAAVGFGLLLWALRRGAPWARLKAHALRLALLGTLGYGVFSTLVLLGLMHSVPSHGAVVMATMPITTQFVRWLFDGQRPGRAAVLGSVLALAGVVTVSGVLQQGGEASTLAGDLTAWVGTLGWIAYTRGAASLPQLDVLEYSGLTALAAWPVMMLAALVGAALGWSAPPSSQDLLAVGPSLLYVGIVPTVVAVLAYNFGVRALGLVAGTAFLNFVPVSAVLMGVALGKPPETHELAGVAMVVAALLIHTLALRQAGPAPTPSVRTAPATAAP
ncbi:DMT family transporter [Ideonella sp. YS5]|uniref:DMT family transporter n=1 Tax=Ideonella sp. YS5 TaxID=3453714 RepID=UPI003EE8A79E